MSQNQYSQLLGHASKVMGASYISSLSAVDVQGIINQETIRQDHIQMLRSMRLHLNLDVRTSLPFQHCMAILEDPELDQHDADIKQLEEQMRADGDDTELCQQRQEVLWTRKRHYNKLYKKALQKFRGGEFVAADSSKVRKMIEDGKKGLQDLIEEPGKKQIQHANLDFVPLSLSDRHLIATSFWTQTPNPNSIPDATLVSSLQNICRPQAYTLYYPGESPVDDCCPLCNLAMSELRPYQRPDHIHKCFQDTYKNQAEVEFLSSQPVVCRWGDCKNPFAGKQIYLSDDFARDISDPEERRRARAKESKRLNDMRRRGKVSTSQNQAVQGRKSISTHLKRHVHKQTQCLWDGCTMHCTSEQDLMRHLWKYHGVTVKQASFQPQFCFEHPQDGWFTDEFDWEDHCRTHQIRQNINLRRSHHMLVAGLQCPFCLATQSAFSKRFKQFTNRSIFNRHIDAHEKSFRNSGITTCPIPSCTDDTFSTFFELRIHLFDTHDLKPTGFTRSRGFCKNKFRPVRSVGVSKQVGNFEQDEVEEEELVDNNEQDEVEEGEHCGEWDDELDWLDIEDGELNWLDTDSDEDDEDGSEPEQRKRKEVANTSSDAKRRRA